MSENNSQEPVPIDSSQTERLLWRLVVPQPSGFAQCDCIDFLHHPHPELLSGQE